jgi:hypothetical protein
MTTPASPCDLPDQAGRGTIFMNRSSVAGLFTSREDILDKTIAGLLGAAAALGTISSSQATPMIAPIDVLRANSYAELLAPIDKASEFLRALDAERTARANEGQVELVRYHHHHHYLRRAHHQHQDEYVRIR